MRPKPPSDVAVEPFKLPANLDAVALTGDESGSGVWVFAEGPASDSGAFVFHWTARDRQLGKFSLSLSYQQAAVGIEYGIATDRHGDLFLGLNQTIVEIDETTGSVRYFHLPLHVLTDSQGHVVRYPNAIDSVATSADGKVFVAVGDAERLFVLDPSSGRLASLILPPGTVQGDAGTADLLAFSPQGAMYVVVCTGGRPCELGMLERRGSSWLVPQNSDVSGADGVVSTTEFIAFAGFGQVIELDSTGAAIALRVPAGEEAPALLPNGSIAVAHLGVEVASRSGQTRQLSIGETEAGPPSCPAGSSCGTFVPHLVPVTPDSLTADGAGDVWFIPDNSPNSVGEIAAAVIS